jgi:hypothetical protein
VESILETFLEIGDSPLRRLGQERDVLKGRLLLDIRQCFLEIIGVAPRQEIFI